jgi:hypothetical protein
VIFLIDHNIEGQSLMLFGSITSEGWLETLPIRFISFDEVELPITSSDRVVWRFAQENQMILLTANRSMKGEDSLEQVIREECLPTSLPVVTFANVARIIEREYREECVDRLIEIALYLENYLGSAEKVFRWG